MALKNENLWALVAALVCFFMFYPVMSHFLLSPNQHMYTFGGDGLTIYYDMSYHISYGSGHTFTGMNYPYGELIYMTDAQGALSIFLNWVNNYLFDISGYTIGIINFLNAFSVILCSVVLYYLFRMMEVKIWIAIVFSSLITLLSPQIFRLVAHFGLAYLFMIPLCFIWIIQKTKVPDFKYYDVILALLVFLITLNNPYLGFIAASTMMLSGLYLFYVSKFKKSFLYISTLGLLPLVLAYGYIKMADHVTDRIKIQWGYFSLQASPKGMIAPKGSLMEDVMKWFGQPGYEIDFESWANLGIVTIVLLVMILVGLFIKKSSKFHFSVPASFRPILFSSIVLLTYSTGLLFLPFEQDYIEDKLGFLLMFKAVGRLIWPFYYAMTILAVLYLNHLSSGLKSYYVVPFIVLAALVWKWEINTYILTNFKDKVHGNFLGNSQKNDVNNLFKGNNIDPGDFQAILSLPKLMTWTDNFISEVNWSTQYHSMNISRSTGLPMVNAMLSRMSIGQTAESIELLANPLVEKSLPSKFPNQKDILIVLGADHPPLSSGEKFLVEISDTIYSEPNGFKLLRLSLNKINNNQYIKEAQLNLSKSENHNTPLYYDGFENEESKFSYFGKGSKMLIKGEHTLIEDTITDPLSDHYVFSVWTKIDNLKYGIGWFTCEVKRPNGETIYKETPDTRRSNDVHDDWIRTELTFPVEKDCTVRITFNNNRTLFIDELLVQPASSTVVLTDKNSNESLYNGFRIKNQ